MLKPRSTTGICLALLGVFGLGCEGGEIVDPSTLPRNQQQEICGDFVDNDGNGLTDCGDSACSGSSQCNNTSTAGPLKPPWNTCAEAVGDRSHSPLDLIWTVDSSASMRDELDWIREHLNRFADYLLAIQADIHLILLGGPDVCVPQPLGGPNCTDGPRFRHVDKYVGNDDTLAKVISLLPDYGSFLRADAKRAILVASDTNPCASAKTPMPAVCRGAGVTAAGFDQDIKTIAGFPTDYVLHSIVAFDEAGNHPRGCSTGQNPGTTYLTLTEMTNGLKFKICNANWREVVDELGKKIAELVNVPCTYAMPPTNGQAVQQSSSSGTDGGIQQPTPTRPSAQVNPKLVQVDVEVNGRWQTAPEMPNASACNGQHGWYRNGDNIQLCDLSCTGLAVRQVHVQFGCATDLQ